MDSDNIKDLVSTIIPVFNRPTMIVEAVASVLAQDYRPIEIIIVDDGSTDSTSDVLATLAATHDEIKIFTQTNAGAGAARELGRCNASGEYIQYLDSDDLLLPSKFSKQVNALNKQPECGVAYGKTELLTDGVPRYEQAWKRTGEEIATMFPSFIRQRWWGTSTPLYRRDVTDKIGSWGNTINEEDWEYDCRIAALGTRLVFINKFVSVQRRHDDHLSHAGTSDPVKLGDRCRARQKMYNSVCNSSIPIPNEDMVYFSKAVFLLARQCAAIGLAAKAKEMIDLSIIAMRGAGIKQRVFGLMGKMIGWRLAARLVSALGY